MSLLPQSGSLRSRLSEIHISGSQRVAIGHALVDSCTFQQACRAILEHAISGGTPAYIITPNAQHIVLLNRDTRLREIYRNADLVVPDGISLLLASRLFRRPLPERITGVDLFQSLCASATSNNLRVFFLGGLPGAAELAAKRLQEVNPSLQVSTYCPPSGFENDSAELGRIQCLVKRANPHILFAGLGAPKQDNWIYDHGRKLDVNVLMGIGGSFEMVGGLVRRAPLWIRRLGCEWLYRLWKEPRRTWRRYSFGNAQFLYTIGRQFFRLLTAPTSKSTSAEREDVTATVV